MVCHLGDATAMVLGTRPREVPQPLVHRPVTKLLALWSPVRWPRGQRTNPMHNPRERGTRPTVFDADRSRAVEGLRELAAARPGTLEPAHGLFGAMSVRDWQRWAYRHTDHHLRQFGV